MVRTLTGACLAAVTASLILSGGNAVAASGPMTQAAFVSAAPSGQRTPYGQRPPSGQRTPYAQQTPSGQRTPSAQQTPSGRAAAQSAPSAPAGLVATAGDGQVTLSWAAPSSDGGSPVTRYNVYAATTEAFTISVRETTVAGQSGTVSKLTSGVRYYFWVTAGNAAGESPPSGVASAAPAAAASTPGSPAGLTATAGSGRVTLSWSAPASDGGSPVTGYDVYLSATRAFSGGLQTFKSPGTNLVITNLADGTTYYFKVAAVNAKGTGPVSAVASAITRVRAQPAPPGPPTGLSVRAGQGQVTLSWTPPDGSATISGYLIYEGTSRGGEASTPVSSSAAHATSYTIVGLTSGTRYYFQVAAVDTAGRRSVPSAEASAVALSSAASGPTTAQTAGEQPAGQPSGKQQGPASAIEATNLTRNSSSPRIPAWLIIALTAVAVAASAGAVAVCAHLRRTRIRQGRA